MHLLTLLGQVDVKAMIVSVIYPGNQMVYMWNSYEIISLVTIWLRILTVTC